MNSKLHNGQSCPTKILFVLGRPNPFPGAGWTRIGFFAENWFNKRHKVDVLGAFSYKSLQKRGGWKFGKVETQQQVYMYSVLQTAFNSDN